MVFERNILAFRGKSWLERNALRRLAWRRDKRIPVRVFFINLLLTPWLLLLMQLRKHEVIPTLWLVGVIYLAIGVTMSTILHALWINSLVEEALLLPPDDSHQSAEQTSAKYNY